MAKFLYALLISLFFSTSWAQYESNTNPSPEEMRKIKINKLFSGPQMIGTPLPLLTFEARHDEEMHESKASLTIPLYKNEIDSWSLSLNGNQLHFEKAMKLNSSDYEVPQSLSKAELGLHFNRKLNALKTWGIKASIGYAGDEPSSADQELTYSFMMNYGYPSEDKKGFWNWILLISNNGPFVNYFPIPGFVYIHRTPTFTGVFGFPVLSLHWNLNPDVKYSLALMGVNIFSELTYGQLDKYQVYGHYSLTQQSYLPHNRPEKKDRLNIQEQKASVGFRKPLYDSFMLDLQTGYSYDRSIYMGNKLLNKSKGSKPLDAEWYAQINLKYAL